MNEHEDFEKLKKLGIDPTPMMGNNGERYITGPDGGLAHVLPTVQPKRGKGYGHVDEERDANARLIAAAPAYANAWALVPPDVKKSVLAEYARRGETEWIGETIAAAEADNQ